MKYRLVALLLVLSGSSVMADNMRPPLERQFFEFFRAKCSEGMRAEIKTVGKNPDDSKIADAIARYCTCTSQAVVSYLTAEEIISFSIDPEKEPAASKMKPYFQSCHGAGGQKM